MPYRNRGMRGMSLRPVNRIKHVFDLQGAGVAGTQVSTNFMLTSDTPDLATTTEVETGSTVHGIYMHLEAIALTSGALPNFYMFVAKNPGGNLTFPNGNVVGADDNKKYVIHQEMVMFQRQDGSNPRTIFNGVIKFPKHLRRNGPNDIWTLRVFSPGVNFEFCVQIHWKEFR